MVEGLLSGGGKSWICLVSGVSAGVLYRTHLYAGCAVLYRIRLGLCRCAAVDVHQPVGLAVYCMEIRTRHACVALFCVQDISTPQARAALLQSVILQENRNRDSLIPPTPCPFSLLCSVTCVTPRVIPECWRWLLLVTEC